LQKTSIVCQPVASGRWQNDNGLKKHSIYATYRPKPKGAATVCRTVHEIHFANAAAMEQIHSQSVQLVVTSPPYPMIDMWDDLFCQDPETATLLLSENGVGAFASMHRQLDRIWKRSPPGAGARRNRLHQYRRCHPDAGLKNSRSIPTTAAFLPPCWHWDSPTCPTSCGASRPTRPTNSWGRG
jgi:hypothetical protein